MEEPPRFKAIPNEFRVTAKRLGRPTDERRQLRDSVSTCNQRRRNLKGEGYKWLKAKILRIT
ncbi:hypothetical protein [Candidatus Regiella endosymbiont of Tuberolachnus salignus]|uniref:hypothetical protein n=1 Tax=Candidatus Regiella endosymbiont of Tuberolachnus salignus TaxID=3077956 RepID=UPI0030D086A5